ncbi:hypothetical protein BT96DRAFT_355251 [Gymnopus androsaceus JB14]|uniref:3'-5' exonuclease domain-containing protein n=1 Tax=Gymnopus androsaceus JB14 TaxID=1447944 RepID=A0A6A4GYE3_9AGAR|nr:hypothetical protein BT96DRAFT_355251 [Gymnopus androsaceus JB14]
MHRSQRHHAAHGGPSSVLESLRRSRSDASSATSTQTSWSLCNSEETLDEALNGLLSSCRIVALDCEGDDLGRSEGTLSLICMRTISPATSNTVVIDVLAFSRGSSSLKRFFALIESESIQKIVFDGRMDFCAFFYEYGVHMKNVLDMQLADVEHRISPEQTMNPRQFSYRSPGEVHMLTGMASCLRENGITASPKESIDHHAWLVRPMQKKHLSYAAHDVELIEAIYNAFQRRGYIKPSLPEQSQRYITLWSDFQPATGDFYRSNAFLPLEVFVQGSPQDRMCGGCKRKLSIMSFSSRQAKMCFVCNAVRANMGARIEDNLDHMEIESDWDLEDENEVADYDCDMLDPFGDIWDF